ncbi:MAG: hypothetical protein ACR2NZ_11390 [Rubripirellula sp.]
MMWFIVIFALIATVALYRRANRNGLHPGKVASIPFVAAGLFLILDHLASRFIGLMSTWLEVSDGTRWGVLLLSRLLLVAAFSMLIRFVWVSSSAGDPQGSASEEIKELAASSIQETT